MQRERTVSLTVPCAVTRGFEVSQEGTLPPTPPVEVHAIPSFKIQFLYIFHILEKGDNLSLKVIEEIKMGKSDGFGYSVR